jgi:hypothetical protein
MTYHITAHDQKILDAIARNPGLASPDIGYAVGLPMSQASGRLSRLTANKLVDRKQDPKSGQLVRYLYYPLQVTGLQAAGTVLPPSAREIQTRPYKAPTPQVESATIRVTAPRREDDLPLDEPTPVARAPLSPMTFDIEGAIRGISHSIATRILQGIDDHVIDHLADSVVARVSARIGDRMVEEVSGSVDRAVGTALSNVEARINAAFTKRVVPEPVRLAPSKKLRIMVLGLLGNQQEEIRREFGKEIELRFIDTDATRNASSWKGAIGGMDYVIAMIKWMPHVATNILSSHKGYIPINGGLSDLSNRLTEIYVEGK